MQHSAEKQDIGTLEYQFNTLVQGRDNITAYYQKTYEILLLVLDKIDCLDYNEVLIAMTNSYRHEALDKFISGLYGNLPSLLNVKRPKSLSEALNICLKLDNLNFGANQGKTMQVNNK